MNNYDDYVAEALDMVSAWEIPEEEFAQAVNDQVRLMCGMNQELSSDLLRYSPYATLRF